jgi:hypothetical protein
VRRGRRGKKGWNKKGGEKKEKFEEVEDEIRQRKRKMEITRRKKILERKMNSKEVKNVRYLE